MTDIVWYSSEENVNWGEWREVERLPLRHRIARWYEKKRGYKYVIGLAWPRKAKTATPAPMLQYVFGPVAAAQQQVIALLSLRGAIPGEAVMLAVAGNYEAAKKALLYRGQMSKPDYEVSHADQVGDEFEFTYTPVYTDD